MRELPRNQQPGQPTRARDVLAFIEWASCLTRTPTGYRYSLAQTALVSRRGAGEWGLCAVLGICLYGRDAQAQSQ